MSGVVRLILEKQLKSQKSEFVFSRPDGLPYCPNYVSRHFLIAQRELGTGKRIKFHDIRHSFASNFMMNGGSLFELQKILGHSDQKMTLRYSHFTPDHLQSSLQYMNMEIEGEIKSVPDLSHGSSGLSLCR